MIPTEPHWAAAPIHLPGSIDSSNNYAMQLLHADKAPNGTIVIADTQTAGRGQRGKTWEDEPGAALLMSLIYVPQKEESPAPFDLSACAALAVVRSLLDFFREAPICIKWPNDIFIGDKKAAGILMENSFRGSELQYAIVGIGINIGQKHFPAHLAQATSLRIAFGESLPQRTTLSAAIRTHFYALLEEGAAVHKLYNHYLYRKGLQQHFLINGKTMWAGIDGVDSSGRLCLTADGKNWACLHGQVEWLLY